MNLHPTQQKALKPILEKIDSEKYFVEFLKILNENIVTPENFIREQNFLSIIEHNAQGVQKDNEDNSYNFLPKLLYACILSIVFHQEVFQGISRGMFDVTKGKPSEEDKQAEQDKIYSILEQALTLAKQSNIDENCQILKSYKRGVDVCITNETPSLDDHDIFSEKMVGFWVE